MCFSLYWLLHVLISLVIVGGVVALLRLVLPYVLSLFGVAGDLVMRAINIIVVVVMLLWLLYFLIDLLSCAGTAHLRY